jgi:hypothetical protein
VTQVTLYRDNGDGVFNALTDTVLANGNYGSDNGTVTLNFSATVSGASTADLWVVYDLTAASAGTYQATIASNASMTGTGAGQGLVFTGAPVTGSMMTVLTATPTMTSTQTATVTATYTPIVKTKICPPSPNPAGGQLDFCVSVPPATSMIRCEIYTLAFRKVGEKSFPAPAPSSLSLDLVDTYGQPLANGLYYLKVTVTGPSPAVETFKVLVIR